MGMLGFGDDAVRQKVSRALTTMALAFVVMVPQAAVAQGRAFRALRSLSVEVTSGGWDLDLSFEAMASAVRAAAGEEGSHFPEATSLATALLGDAIYTNPFLLGYAFQLGRLPVSLEALHRAIELNGRAVEQNRRAFAWGRLAVHAPAAVEEAAKPGRRK